jgi:hypothetical protein
VLVRIVNPFYSAGFLRPETDGDRFELWDDDGQLLTTVWRNDEFGAYTLVRPREIIGTTILYRDWTTALAEGSGESLEDIEAAGQDEAFE